MTFVPPRRTSRAAGRVQIGEGKPSIANRFGDVLVYWEELLKFAIPVVVGFLSWLAFRNRPHPIDVSAHVKSVGGERTLVEGGRMYSRSFGQGPDLVMLPGFAGNSSTWEFITPDLASDHHVHLVDLLGHGFSDKPTTAAFDGDFHAACLVEWLRVHEVQKPVVIASSAGCQAAVVMASAYPQHVRGLVLVDPFLIAGRGIRFVLAIAKLFPRVTSFVTRQLYAQRWFVCFGQMLGRRDPWRVTAADVDRQYLPYGTPGFFEALPAMLAGIDPSIYHNTVQQVECPVLLVWGAADRTATLGQARWLGCQFQHAETLILAEAGHLPQEEVPSDLVARLRPFLRSVETSVAPRPSATSQDDPG